jgi:hypothetical protein
MKKMKTMHLKPGFGGTSEAGKASKNREAVPAPNAGSY